MGPHTHPLKPLSLYRGRSHAGLGDDGSPIDASEAGGNNQYLRSGSDLENFPGLLKAAVTWMTVDLTGGELQDFEGDRELTGWVSFNYKKLRFIARLGGAPQFEGRPGWFTHAWGFDAKVIEGAYDPGAYIGNHAAFDKPWRESPPPGLMRQPPLPAPAWDRTMVTAPEFRNAARSLTAHLYHSILGNVPVVVEADIEEFRKDNPRLVSLISVARAALPPPLKRNCQLRMLTHSPVSFLNTLGTNLLVLNSDEARLVRQQSSAVFVDSAGRKRQGDDPKRECRAYADALFEVFAEDPSALLEFGALFERLPGDALSDQAIKTLPDLYRVASRSSTDSWVDYLWSRAAELGEFPVPPDEWVPPGYQRSISLQKRISFLHALRGNPAQSQIVQLCASDDLAAEIAKGPPASIARIARLPKYLDQILTLSRNGRLGLEWARVYVQLSDEDAFRPEAIRDGFNAFIREASADCRWRPALKLACENLLACGSGLPDWLKTAPLDLSAAGDDIDIRMLINELRMRSGQGERPNWSEEDIDDVRTLEQQRSFVARGIDPSWKSIRADDIVKQGKLVRSHWLKNTADLLADKSVLEKCNVEQFFEIVEVAQVHPSEIWTQLDLKVQASNTVVHELVAAGKWQEWRIHTRFQPGLKRRAGLAWMAAPYWYRAKVPTSTVPARAGQTPIPALEEWDRVVCDIRESPDAALVEEKWPFSGRVFPPFPIIPGFEDDQIRDFCSLFKENGSVSKERYLVLAKVVRAFLERPQWKRTAQDVIKYAGLPFEGKEAASFSILALSDTEKLPDDVTVEGIDHLLDVLGPAAELNHSIKQLFFRDVLTKTSECMALIDRARLNGDPVFNQRLRSWLFRHGKQDPRDVFADLNQWVQLDSSYLGNPAYTELADWFKNRNYQRLSAFLNPSRINQVTLEELAERFITKPLSVADLEWFKAEMKSINNPIQCVANVLRWKATRLNREIAQRNLITLVTEVPKAFQADTQGRIPPLELGLRIAGPYQIVPTAKTLLMLYDPIREYAREQAWWKSWFETIPSDDLGAILVRLRDIVQEIVRRSGSHAFEVAFEKAAKAYYPKYARSFVVRH
jgi:hypothetical protein